MSALTEPTPPDAAEPAAQLNGPVVLSMIVLHGLGLAAFTQPFQLAYLPLMVVTYCWGALATTLYLHRCLAHRGLTLAAPVRAFLAVGTAIPLGGDPAVWVGIHRSHHGKPDQPGDPHSPRQGFWHGHVGWAFRVSAEQGERFRALAPDVRQDPLCRRLEHPAVYAGCHLGIAAAAWAVGGWGGLLWGFYLPIVLLAHATFAVNSVGHTARFGSRRFETRDDSRNVGWLALPTFGESFHNNHHANPRRARHGLTWREVDLTACVIRLLERCRLARDVAW